MQILIGILATVPFTVTIFLGGLSSIQDELYDAAALEGAGPFDQFRYITFPLMKPFINIALVLNTIYVFNSFPIIWAMTQGGPANSTDILVTYLYKLAFRWGKLGEAAAVSLLMFVILLIFTVIYVRLAMREDSGEGETA
jgi:multiple sugar transport system permease protein